MESKRKRTWITHTDKHTNNNNNTVHPNTNKVSLDPRGSRRPRVPAFCGESLSTLIHDTRGWRREPPPPPPPPPSRCARLAANSPCLNDLYKSRDDSVCQPADAFVCFHLKEVGSSVCLSEGEDEGWAPPLGPPPISPSKVSSAALTSCTRARKMY